ncbi:MAG: D-alanyl-D-alanine carboxypeptidase family protein [Thermaerobacterales bacterium]
MVVSLALLLPTVGLALGAGAGLAPGETGQAGTWSSTVISGAERPVPVLDIDLDLSARSAVLMDTESGRLLFGRSAHEPLPPASTTKVMTALIALEQGNLNDRVTVSERAAATGEASIWLAPGEQLTLEELLIGMLVGSGNDAAMAVAEHVGGTVESFITLMNRRARELGAADTHFSNPHGLHADDHVTSAYDLALITRQAMQIPLFREIVAARQAVIPWPDEPWDRRIRAHNRLLTGYEGADGVKTGFTRPAGRCLVGHATRDRLQLTAVVLNAPDTYGDVAQLLDLGFERFRRLPIIQPGQAVIELPVSEGTAATVRAGAAESRHAALLNGEADRIELQVKLSEPLAAPVARGQRVGEIRIMLAGQELGHANLVSLTAVDVPLLQQFWRNFRNMLRRAIPG